MLNKLTPVAVFKLTKKYTQVTEVNASGLFH